MRILFISTTFPDASSPARGTYNSALCQALSQEHQVRVIAPRAFTEAIPFRLKKNRYQLPNELQSSNLAASYPTFWYTPKVMQEKSGDQMWWSVKSEVQKAVNEFQPEAVLSYWAHPEGEVGVRTAQLANVPSAVIVGGSDVLILPNLPKRGPRVRDVLLQSETVITVSDGLRNSVIELGANPDRVQTIYQGIDPQVFHQHVSRSESQQQLKLSSERKHLVWVGRMVPVKALDVLIDAASELLSQKLPFELHLIGNGPERSRLEMRVEQCGLSESVRFEGTIGHDQIADWYRAADLTVMSSDSEGLPNVLRESLACGTPFVSTDVGSISEIADSRYSQLVPKQNSNLLAKAIVEVLDESYAKNARQYQARTWDKTALETASLFERLRSEKSSSRTGASMQNLPSEIPIVSQ
ncbi:glycosyltransferase [Thalassoglobus sp.]|uniref:glycosyltransferase n=1 Tax=Thalassoglobus sp. TaxID=2795869 RepID=UPI003AA831BF